ncbi:MAG: hypothetical protein COB36_14035 [Alphaproteobacteria bacterium]|nr:MAG: hypothetical protein COB36_14035 [Alphaproteobacteria bacterium]
MQPEHHISPSSKITRTEYKLEEARFFLKHMEQHWNHVSNVDFYLSAFVSAARSITWIMKAEFGKNTDWSSWYESQKPTAEIDALLAKMTKVRNRSIKSTPLKTQTIANVHIPLEDLSPEGRRFLTEGALGDVRLEPFDDTNTIFTVKQGDTILGKARLKAAEHLLPEFGGQDLKNVCREYLTELEELVQKCLAKFKVQEVS